ncbi:MAG: sulfite exporter TauE/SafE family protein [Candidatus Saccharimonadales bacterium]
MTEPLLIILGLVSGLLAGVVGLGGGIIIVPALVLLFGFSQKLAQGTTLALLIPPIGFFAAWAYYKAGHVNVKAAAFIIIGFILGSYLGAKFATQVPDKQLTKVFGAFLIIVGIKMLFFK